MKGKVSKETNRADRVTETARRIKKNCESGSTVNDVFKDVLEIVRKYQRDDDDLYAPHCLGDLQKDAMRLVALNFTLSGEAVNRRADFARSKNATKIARSKSWILQREKADKELSIQQKQYVATAGKGLKPQRKTDGMLEAECLITIEEYLGKEVDTEEAASLMEAAVQASQEIVNVMKKVIDRLMAELHLQNFGKP